MEEIRKRTACREQRPTVRDATRAWFISMSNDYPLALTLTLKQVIKIKTPTGVIRRRLTREHSEKIAQKFIEKLNGAVFGNFAKRHGKSLKYIPVIEGERSNKNLHLHFAIGGLPETIMFNEFYIYVEKAKYYTENVDEQYKIDIADSGWLEYLSKETAKTHSDNVLWTLVK